MTDAPAAAELIHLPSNDALTGMVRYVPSIVYSTTGPRPLVLDLLVPWGMDDDVDVPARPLVVFIQGSGCPPDRSFELPQLAQLAKAGYVGVTGDLPALRTREWAEESDAVHAVVACFGPCDMERFIDERTAVGQFDYLMTDLCRSDADDEVGACPADPEAWREVARAISPVRYVTAGTGPHLPAFLLALGSEDEWMPEWTLTLMHERLSACGARSTGAPPRVGAPARVRVRWGRRTG